MVGGMTEHKGCAEAQMQLFGSARSEHWGGMLLQTRGRCWKVVRGACQPCGELGAGLGREPVEEDSLCKRKGGCSDQGTAWVGFFPHDWMRKDTSTEKLQKELDRKVYSECEPPQIVKYAVPVMKGRACVWPMPTLSEKGKDAEGNCVNSERCNSELQTEIKL